MRRTDTLTVQSGRSDRAQLAEGDWWAAPDAEIAAASRDYFAYCGTYELRGGEVVHRVELSLLPNWIGAEQVPLVALDANRVSGYCWCSRR